MRYFIDFEATQYTNEIIQIGCIREDGQTFQSLIRPRMLSKVTKWITNLTGITKDMLREADYSDVVFEKFLDWVSADNSKAQFFCYGNSDLIFVKTNLKKCTRSLKAQFGLSIIAANLIDVTELVREHFNLSSAPALKKVMEYYYPNDTHEWHNALSDAEMLKMVYESMRRETKPQFVPECFAKYVNISSLTPNSSMLHQLRVIKRKPGSIVYQKYDSIDLATSDVVSEIEATHQNAPDKTKVKNRIINAINKRSTYCGYEWSTEVRTS